MIPCTGRALFLCRDDYGLRDTIADLLLLFQASNLGIYYTPFRSAVFSVDSAKKEKILLQLGISGRPLISGLRRKSL